MSDASYWNGFVAGMVEKVRAMLTGDEAAGCVGPDIVKHTVELTLDYLLSSGYLICRGGLPQKRS